jgi:hypothetical protein
MQSGIEEHEVYKAGGQHGLLAVDERVPGEPVKGLEARDSRAQQQVGQQRDRQRPPRLEGSV